ncbi:hypothetical protein [Chitinophaga sp.]|uniref:hypothetical protein n=1 Tax=Chitinophaga sp. TaxID=1869181 RepID=UPI0031D214AE
MKRYLTILIFSLLVAAPGYQARAQSSTCACDCLKPLFDYLIASNRLFTKESDHILLSTLIADANAAGYSVSGSGCSILTANVNRYFYALTTATTGTQYKAQLGDCSVVLKSASGNVTFSSLASRDCDNSGVVSYSNGRPVTKKYMVTRSVNVNSIVAASNIFPSVTTYTTTQVDSTAAYMRTAYASNSSQYKIATTFAIDSAVNIPASAIVLSANLYFYAYPAGFNAPTYTNAHSLYTVGNPQPIATVYRRSAAWSYQTSASSLLTGSVTDTSSIVAETAMQDFQIDIKKWFSSSRRSLDYGITLVNTKTVPTTFPTDTTTLYATFCSEKYTADLNKRPYLDITWTFATDTGVVATLYIDSCLTCNYVPSGTCYSAITDTSVNPYLYGVAGNWRPYRTLSFYNPRTEATTSNITNTRTDGTLSNFLAFWQLVGNKWQPQDTAVSRWVWSAQTTLINQKGGEIETIDPLGNYISGVFGFQDALATAVAQNARYREVAFDGFEDYNYVGGECYNVCPVARSFDFSTYQTYFDTAVQHTGNYSLRLDNVKMASVTSDVTADDPAFNIAINAAANNCGGTDSILKSIRLGKDALLPTFSPLPGKKVIVGAWVKESGQCNGIAYTGSQIQVDLLNNGNVEKTITGSPSGNIIEGWQRIEMIVEIPATTTQFMISLKNTGSNTVYFDDLRVHPYNANMKSYVYDEASLRLMAELDENNYATFYEYDDEGDLIRLKKETERGIMTIKESRSAMTSK